jgi:osmotically-inducible protein OsmY
MRTSLVLAATLLALAGCENKAPRPKTDAALTERVKVALEQRAALEREAKIEVDANSGVVMLKGAVHSDAAKQRIQEVAKSVDGVTWVQNQVSVAPPSKG